MTKSGSTGPAPETSALGRVLVVDDEDMIRKLAVRILEEEGFGVSEAEDGMAALTILQAASKPVECVVTDIVMPRLNGVELMQRLSLSHPGLPVILMSGFGTAQLTRLGITTPCSVLVKPFPAEVLVSEVRRCLKLRN